MNQHPWSIKCGKRFNANKAGRLLLFGLMLIAAVLGRQMAYGQSPAARADDVATWQALDTNALDRLRGGFFTADGLKISLGIERMVLINGVLQSSLSLNVGDRSKPVQGASPLLPGWDRIQNGAGNALPPGAMTATAPGFGTIVQNSLNRQLIQTVTIINVQLMDTGFAGARINGRLLSAQIGATIRSRAPNLFKKDEGQRQP